MKKSHGVSLSSVLDTFQIGLTKEAMGAEGMEYPEGVTPAPESVEAPEAPEGVGAPEAPEGVEAPAPEGMEGAMPGVDAEVAIEAAAENVAEAIAVKNEALDTLKEVAKTAQEKEDLKLTKQAQDFGRLFAESAMATFDKTAALEDIGNSAYETTIGKLAEDETEELTAKLDKVAAESRDMTLLKLAEMSTNLEDDVTASETAKKEEKTTKKEDAAVNVQGTTTAAMASGEMPSPEAGTKVAEEDLLSMFKEAYEMVTEHLNAPELDLHKVADDAYAITKQALDDIGSKANKGEKVEEGADAGVPEETEDTKETTEADTEV